MHTENLFDKIRLRVGSTPEIRAEKARVRMAAIDQKLSAQLKAQKMTPEVLSKRSTL